MEIKVCKFCFEEEKSKKMINPCICSGSSKWVHEKCLMIWISQSSHSVSPKCEICKYSYSLIVKKNLIKDCFLKLLLNPRHSLTLCLTVLLSLGTILGIYYLITVSNQSLRNNKALFFGIIAFLSLFLLCMTSIAIRIINFLTTQRFSRYKISSLPDFPDESTKLSKRAQTLSIKDTKAITNN